MRRKWNAQLSVLEEGEPEHRPVETETESPGVVAAQQV